MRTTLYLCALAQGVSLKRRLIYFRSRFMEYVPGCPLRDSVLKHGAFGDAVVKSFTAQILEGLAFLHARRVMHGVRIIPRSYLPVLNLRNDHRT